MNEPTSRRRPGLFIVDIDDQRTDGLTAQEVAALLEKQAHDDIQIFRILRVDDQGRTEMVGVSPALFAREDGMIFYCRFAETARADFDAVRSAAEAVAPPCPIQVELAEVASGNLSHAVMIAFPAPCNDAVANWLLDAKLKLGDKISAGASALEEYAAGDPQVIERFSLG